MTNPAADQTVEIVGPGGQADYKVQVVGDQVVDLTGASPGDVLVVQPDGTLAPAPPVTGGAVNSVSAASAKIVVGGTATDPTVDVGTGIAQASVTNLTADLGAKASAASVTSEASTRASFDSSLSTAITDEASRATAAEALKLAKASNLSDLASAATARTNLGLGTAATSAATAFAPSSGIAESAVTNLTTDLAAKALAADLTAEASTARTAEAAKVATAGHTSNSVPAASGSTSLADLVMGASTILARLAAGNIVAATPAELKTLLAIAQSDVSGLVAALALLAPIASPTFTGVATAPSLSATGKTGATATPVTLAGGTASGAPTTGAHLKGEVVVDDTGAAWYCTVAGTPGTWVQIGARTGLIGSTSYNPSVNAAPGTTSTTFADVDATNLAVAFTVPASGRVLVRLAARAQTGTNTVLAWNVREASADVVGSDAVVAYASAGSSGSRAQHSFVIAGLTPGAAKTWKWGQARNFGSSSAATSYGGASLTGDGPALMEVWSA